MPERNAISGVNGDKISKIGFTSIRNAAASYYQILDLTNGTALVNQSVGEIPSAYYYVNGAQWKQTYWNLTTNQAFKGIADNTLIEMGITLIPEYYVDREGNVDWDALGDGVTFSMQFTVDNTAPVLNDVAISLMNNTMTVDVTDNQYIAAVALLNYAGTQAFIVEGSQADAVAGEACEYVLDLEGISGRGFLLAVYDYAMNCTVYEINTQIGEVVDTPEQVVLSKTSMVMVKDETAKLTATVYPTNISDASVVWSSTNNNVVTVSSDGTVTAVGAGKAQIVAASKLDPDVKAVCNVQVIDVAVDMNAIIWDEQGSIWYSSFNTATLPEYKKLGSDLLVVDYISSACSAPDGTIYACSMDPNTMEGAMYVIDPVTYEATKLTDCIVQGQHIFYADLAYAPNFFGTGVDALFAIYGPFVMLLDPTSGECIGIMDQYDTDLVGITTCYGYYDEEYAQSTVATYVIGSDGTLYQELYCYLPAYGMALPFYYYMYEMRMAFSTGIDVGDTWFWNSLAYSAEKAMVFWSKFDYDNDNEVTLYAIDEMNDFAVYNLGDFGDTVWPVGGLHQSVPSYASPDSAVNTSELQAALKREIVAEEHKIERINVVKASLPMAEVTKNSIEIADQEESITVNVAAPEDTTNGVVTVEYDSDALVLKNVVVNGDYISVLEEDGVVTFGYVAMNGIAADEALATLVFDVLDTDASSVTVTYNEINDTTPNTSADLDVEFPHANTEIRDDKEATCTEDGYTGDTYCVDCGMLIAEGEVIEANGHSFGEWTETKAPSCTEAGVETRECACGETEEREVAANGHKHEAVVTAPSCTDKGYTTYTCACGDTYVGDEVDATGHKYASVVTPPTTEAEGYTTHTCEHCGDSYVDSYTDKLPVPDPDNGKTGDDFMAHLWIMCLLGSATAMAVLVICYKKSFKA